MTIFATLGPAGTNHELVTKRYLSFHGLTSARIALVDNFAQAVAGLKDGRFDYVVQCAVHPETPRTLGQNFREVFAVDSFISPSKDLAVLTRKDVTSPKSIGLVLPANEDYVDLSAWAEKHGGNSIPEVFEQFLKGRYDSALVYLEYAEKYPDLVRVDLTIGSPDDVWIVYGRDRASNGKLLSWPDSPTAQRLRQT